MNILKPQKILLENLIKIEDLFLEIDKEDTIRGNIIEDTKKENIELYDKEFENVIFNNVEITDSKLEKNTFKNVQFNNCNFSNTSFEKTTFIRCEFNNCKITGCVFIDARLYNVCIVDSNANYINLSMASIENVLFENIVLRNSYFQENKLKNIYLKKVDLTQTQFINTSLKNIDLSDCIIEGIAVSIQDIRGAIINEFQAIDLLYLIGVKLK